MSEVILFSGPEVFDHIEVRMSAIRIPEVIGALKEAEQVFDRNEIKFIPLTNFLTYEDRLFHRDDEFRKTVISIVQLGLFRRFAKNRPEPQYLLGYFEKSSILDVVTGHKTFEAWLLETPWASRQKTNLLEVNFQNPAQLPVLSKGYAQAPVSLFQLQPKPATPPYFEVLHGQANPEVIMQELHDHQGIHRYITIGLCTDTRSTIKNQVLRESLELLDSVELDPLLSWLWPQSFGSFRAALH